MSPELERQRLQDLLREARRKRESREVLRRITTQLQNLSVRRPYYQMGTTKGGYGSGVALVDTPGYGLASQADWGREVIRYLELRGGQMKRAFVLVEATRGLSEADWEVLRMLRDRGAPHQVVLTKVDRVLWRNKVPGGLQVTEPREERIEELRGICQRVGEELIHGRGGDGDGRGRMNRRSASLALGDIICTSAVANSRMESKLGMNALRWAIMQAAGISEQSKDILEDLPILE